LLLIVILASITKRAQIPFSAWLPAAMAAPSPVSALVHSSTLVTAGVYLLIRFSPVLGMNRFLLNLGCTTMFMSGLGANFEMDLKKIIALSTLRQLGLIFFVLALGYEELAFFHLLSHAFFKSLLFLCAGVFIHGMGDIQDVRFLGGISVLYPVRTIYFFVCSLSLCGFPFLAGFYSKDLILELYIIGYINFFILLIFFLSIFFTGTYSMRLIYYLFVKHLGAKIIIGTSEDFFIASSIGILFALTLCIGSLMA
jgi:NADH-ubiquinone oxidoreductase chain 5